MASPEKIETGACATVAQGNTQSYALAIDSAILRKCPEIDDAVWLVLWAVDRTTVDCICPDGTILGLVLSGRPVRDGKIADELRRPLKWVRRVREKAVRLGLVRQKRWPHGNLLAVVLRSPKFSKKEPKVAPAWAEEATARGTGKRDPQIRLREGKADSTKRQPAPRRVPLFGQSESIQSGQNGPVEFPFLATLKETYTELYRRADLQTPSPPVLGPSPDTGAGLNGSRSRRATRNPLDHEAASNAGKAKPTDTRAFRYQTGDELRAFNLRSSSLDSREGRFLKAQKAASLADCDLLNMLSTETGITFREFPGATVKQPREYPAWGEEWAALSLDRRGTGNEVFRKFWREFFGKGQAKGQPVAAMVRDFLAWARPVHLQIPRAFQQAARIMVETPSLSTVQKAESEIHCLRGG